MTVPSNVTDCRLSAQLGWSSSSVAKQPSQPTELSGCSTSDYLPLLLSSSSLRSSCPYPSIFSPITSPSQSWGFIQVSLLLRLTVIYDHFEVHRLNILFNFSAAAHFNRHISSPPLQRFPCRSQCTSLPLLWPKIKSCLTDWKALDVDDKLWSPGWVGGACKGHCRGGQKKKWGIGYGQISPVNGPFNWIATEWLIDVNFQPSSSSSSFHKQNWANIIAMKWKFPSATGFTKARKR